MTTLKAIHRSAKLPLVIVFALLVVLAFATTSAMAVYPFRLAQAAVSARNENGTPDVQAGSHPWALNTAFVLGRELEDGPFEHSTKDLKVELPPGFVGDPNATPQCAYQEFVVNSCPDETAIGQETTYVYANSDPGVTFYQSEAVYNLVPPSHEGIVADFGFHVAGKVPVFLQTTVRVGSNAGLTITVPNIEQSVLLTASKVTIWGVPASPAHNLFRGKCIRSILGFSEEGFESPRFGLRPSELEVEGPDGPYEDNTKHVVEPSRASESSGGCPTQTPLVPLLTNPTSCYAPRSGTVSADDWEEPGVYTSVNVKMPELRGCEKLDFSPTLTDVPDGTAAATPTGLTVGLHVPQETTKNPAGLAEADVKDTDVTLPQGVGLSSSASDGLQACSTSQIGYLGSKELDPTKEPGVLTPQFTENRPTCPNASKIGNVHIKTPVLANELEGQVYLAAPQNYPGATPENPYGSLVAMYIVAEEPASGLLLKVAGKVVPNPVTGQLLASFDNTPPLPFTNFDLEFFGSDRAPLTTPVTCGTYQTEAEFTPWSGTPTTAADSSFVIDSGPEIEGAAGPEKLPCSNPVPFTPQLRSGTRNINSGSFSNLSTTISREDGQQQLSSLVVHFPEGISGLLSGVTPCPEERANAGTCGPESSIGETITSVGLGSDPFNVEGGQVYLTGPYHGAPFGLAIVNPAKAGPFELEEGRPVVVRAKIEVNPETTELTVTTDPPGSPHAIPTILDGIPLQVKRVYVDINRPGFTFNPTNCNPKTITGTIASTEDATYPVNVPFQVTNCGSLKFEPTLSASTAGNTSKADGASLVAKVDEPLNPAGQADIARVKVELPKILPSRLTTLQKACTSEQFEANPAGCPEASKIGFAVVHTKLLPVPLEGPAIFVSHGGEAFPSLELVLQGDNLTIRLVGATNISPSGITSTTFRALPDQPFNSFELTLPEGPYSALAATGNLCTSKLELPIEFIAQNGAALYQKAPITVTGCTPAISVVSHTVNGKKATIAVSVPSAGTLTASGTGLSRGTVKASGAGTVTVKLTLAKGEQRFLSRHHGRRLKVNVKLHFTPNQGGALSNHVTLLMR